MTIRTRYDTKRENGQTRREYYEHADQWVPELIVPEAGWYLWEWYADISESVGRTHEGVCRPIPPSEFKAWSDMSGRIVWPSEYAILRAMDKAFCTAMNTEFEEYRARQEAERESKRKG